MRISKHGRDLLLLGTGKVLQVLIGLVALRVVTEVLSTEEVGVYYILQAVLALLAFTLYNPLGQFYGRYLIHWRDTKKLKTATLAILGVRLATIPFGLAAATILFHIFGYSTHFTIAEYLVFNTVCLVALVHGLLLNAANVLISRCYFIFISVLTLSLGLAFSYVFVSFFETAMAWMYGLVLIQICVAFALYQKVTRGQKFSSTVLKRLSPADILGRYYFSPSL